MIELTSMNTVRAVNLSVKANPEQSIALGFVNLASKGHIRPQPDVEYSLRPASSEATLGAFEENEDV